MPLSTPKVRKGVIIVAGLGTRFLPVTKSMPKEMLPVLDKPVVQYIVEEMVESGIQEIIFVTSSQKRAIEDHFDRDYDLEYVLEKQGKLDLLKPLILLSKTVRFFYTRQSAPLGNGHALLCAREFIGEEPFVFSDGDSIIDSSVPVIRQLLDIFQKRRASVIGVQHIDNRDAMTRYGNVYGKPTQEPRTFRVERLIEKPSKKNTSPHGLIIGGMRYVFTKDIWRYLENQKAGRSGEIWVADAANSLAKHRPFFAYQYKGTYFDTGNTLGLLKTALHFALKGEDMSEEIRSMLAESS